MRVLSVLVMVLTVRFDMVHEIIEPKQKIYPYLNSLNPGRIIIKTPTKLTKQAKNMFLLTLSFKKNFEASVVIIGVKKLNEIASDIGNEIMA